MNVWVRIKFSPFKNIIKEPMISKNRILYVIDLPFHIYPGQTVLRKLWTKLYGSLSCPCHVDTSHSAWLDQFYHLIENQTHLSHLLASSEALRCPIELMKGINPRTGFRNFYGYSTINIIFCMNPLHFSMLTEIVYSAIIQIQLQNNNKLNWNKFLFKVQNLLP